MGSLYLFLPNNDANVMMLMMLVQRVTVTRLAQSGAMM